MEYKGWKAEVREETVGDRKLNVTYFIDEGGNDWYQLVDKIDRLDNFIIGVNEDGSLCWFDKTARAKYSPPIGGKVVLLSELPDDISHDGSWKYENNKLVKVEPKEPLPRTKEELMQDLMQLKKELDELT